MTASVSALGLYGGLLSSRDVAEHFTDQAELAAILRFEAALAEAEAALGVVSPSAARQISAACAGFKPNPLGLAAATARDGLPVPALVAELRQSAGAEAGPYVHWGATSQDAIDTGLVLRLRDALQIMEVRLAVVIDRLAELADTHRATLMIGRTRGIQAAPTSFGLKAAGWMLPLARHLRRLDQVRKEALVVSLGGAVGNLSVFGGKGPELAGQLGAILGLAVPPMPWHVQRDGLLLLGNWCAGLTQSLGKIGADIALMAQSEVGELVIGSGGGSSTMPNKVNPVAAEVLVALARLAAGQIGTLHQSAIQEHERGGAGWTLEWMVLPQIVLAAAAAIDRAGDLLASLCVDADRMKFNLDASNGLVFAEAASFALAAKMPRPDALRLVKEACQRALREKRHLADVLRQDVSQGMTEMAGGRKSSHDLIGNDPIGRDPIDWAEIFGGGNELRCAGSIIDQALASWREAK